MSDLSVFSDPRSVAVVGASADPAKWGYWLARGALRGAARRQVHLVNAKGATIEGAASVRSLDELAEAPDLVVLCAPAATVPDVVDQALAMGTRGFLGITAGIDAAHGEPGLERRLAERIRAAGARIVGPNCLGLYDAATDLELAWGTFSPGRLAIISQSGQLGLELAGLAAHEGLGVSRFVSVGNQVDVTAAELLDDLVEHEQTRAVVLYLESFTDARGLVATMARLREAGKPVVVLTVGASEASRAAAQSHTGALTAATDVVRAACRAAGASLVDTPAQAVELAHLLLGGPLPAGRRVAIVSDSGGQGAIAADTFARHALEVPRLSDATRSALAGLLPAAAAVANPVDLAGAGEQDLSTYAKVVDVLAESGEVDAVVLSGYFGCYGADTPELVERELEVVGALAGVVGAQQRPVLVHSMSHDSVAVRSMREQAVPTLHTIDAVARSLELATTMAEDAARTVPGAVAEPTAESGKALDYLAGRERVAAAGVAYPGAAPVRSVDDLRVAAAGLSAPYVLKAGWLEHKTEVGGVAVGLADAAAAEAAYVAMSGRLGEGDYVLEEMDRQSDTVELIVGARRDGSFGPVVLVGLGGVQAELYRDVQVALAPVDDDEARRMIEALRAYPLLDGWRGRPAVDVAAAARVVAAVSRLLADDPDLVECEINPLRVGPEGAVAVDALVLAADHTIETSGDDA
ncbi:acetate--CoA ligase family protein [Pimelobacter simplex]|uniref:Acetyl-CoA synthetase (ADP-forming) alpha and beta chains, putative n=1 Tax=Nocardioides simplex TaxID=2045 RepID=A0A0A1DNM0_NOCSI|nr:acetate--CoA ligase [Pimelobacter simplex]AIY18143.1 Acetyl-CoA synthetase (ADP-forming) alpha and beta chains, putative [Pimelobacter simplex]GEB15720.1 CoA-binding protein [Pimelobacter simplex]SFN09830.1 Acyl-CoA synthetase (NDP forming) [Pimelobacter simplex]